MQVKQVLQVIIALLQVTIFFFEVTLFLGKVKKKNVVARSSVKSKYRFMTLATCELIWLKQLIQELKLYECKLMELVCDNQVALHIASNSNFHERTKHIEIDYHFIREKVITKEINIIFVNSNVQLACMLTTSL